jgi:rhamnose transport system permease protein
MTEVASPSSPVSTGSRGEWFVAPQQLVLAVVLLLEFIVFGLLGENFLTRANLLTASAQTVELGLLALALTPIILTGGIDLSVGALVGLSAVIFGQLWRDAGWPPALAAVATLAAAALCGLLNAALITRGRLPPLIVTLGTLSLFRGVAEGLMTGRDVYGNFPEEVAFLGSGTILGLPTPLWIFLPAAVFFYLLVHRATAGRALAAIGYSPEGARYAGLRVARITGSTYVMSGLCAGIAALICIARTGEARANAGSGYELAAITAVVLGGTSIFGGRASILGTLLGLAAIALLTNGLEMARVPDWLVAAWQLKQTNLPGELGGVLTGVLLLASIGLDYVFTRRTNRHREPTGPAAGSRKAGAGKPEEDMRNSQLAVLCTVIVLAALVVVGGNFMLVSSLKNAGAGPAEKKKLVIAMMPKSKGNAYFIACRKGAEEAAKELDVELIWDGPRGAAANPAEQNRIVENWINRKVDVISVAVENQASLSTALRKAQAAGIKVVTWDADAETDARAFFCNQATPQGIADTLVEQADEQMNHEGKFVIISGSKTAANLSDWRDKIIDRLKDPKYAKLKLAEVEYCDDDQAKANDLGQQLIQKHKDIKLIMAICSPAVPGAADAVTAAKRPDIKVIGLGLPGENKKNLKSGVTQAVVLWKTADLGYLAVHAAKAVAEGELVSGAKEFNAGRLGTLKIEGKGKKEGTDIILGTPFVFTKENIDQMGF